MSLIPLKIKGISYSQTQNGAYALILNEIDGDRKLPIVIGAFEAQSIAIALEKVIIHKLIDGVFYANIVCDQEESEAVFDARTSDAIALALRFNAPIFTYESILSKAGINLTVKETPSDTKDIRSNTMSEVATENNLNHLDLNELEVALEKAVKEEDYEKAARIRDEISKRN